MTRLYSPVLMPDVQTVVNALAHEKNCIKKRKYLKIYSSSATELKKQSYRSFMMLGACIEITCIT